MCLFYIMLIQVILHRWHDDVSIASKTFHGWITPLKFNMEPENQPLEKEILFGNHHVQVPC